MVKIFATSTNRDIVDGHLAVADQTARQATYQLTCNRLDLVITFPKRWLGFLRPLVLFIGHIRKQMPARRLVPQQPLRVTSHQGRYPPPTSTDNPGDLDL